VTLLAVESACDTVGVALVRDDGGSAERVHTGGRAHAELLIPSVEEVLAVSGCTVADVDVIAVDIGPGLFTGLRVGVATAKALGQGLSVGLLGLSSLDILASAALERLRAGGGGADGPGVPSDPVSTVVSVVDARRGEVFAAAYHLDGVVVDGPGEPVDPGTVREDRRAPMSPDALEGWLVELVEAHGPVTVVGDGAVRYRHQLSVHRGVDLDLATGLSFPPPLAQARLALARLSRGQAPQSATEVVPDYRRPADARINWEQRAPRTVPAAADGADGDAGALLRSPGGTR
jgi:tRNA threonylcarbamoyladenosine biosynthesis protein TsaB